MAEADPAPTHEPKNSKFKQQALPAWQPILTAGTVLPTFFVIGVAFIPIGVGLMYFSNQVQERQIDYTDCYEDGTEQMCKSKITDMAQGYNSTTGLRIGCHCTMDIDIGEEDWVGDVFIYYGLTNFYQNHRRYVKSRDDRQLYGDLASGSDECSPFLHPPNDTAKKYAPCGAIANSLFNDTIVLEYCDANCKTDESAWKEVKVTKRGIAWESDKKYKFQNPGGNNDKKAIKKAFEENNVVKPMDWQKEVWELDPDD